MKMNSAPGVGDGVLMCWVDDQRIVHATDAMWYDLTAPPELMYVTSVAFGGNQYWTDPDPNKGANIPDSAKYQEWIAFDDIKIYDSIPPGLSEDNE